MKHKYIIEAKKINKLYGSEKNRARRLKKAGETKESIYKKCAVNIALWDVSLAIKPGEIFVIIGLSGSGKSTLVRCFNHLNKPNSGQVFFNGQDLKKLNKKELNDLRRNKIAMIFQHFGLMSHKSVLGNVAFGLEIKGMPRQEREEKAREIIKMVGLEGYEDECISSLSGGMKQRVGIARALATDPEVLLMDEPFSALDPLVRRDMQFELLTIQKKLNKTIVFITHDINEAFKLGDRVAIMKDGELVQVASPEEMSCDPENSYVQDFIDGADKAQVITAQHAMITPNSIVRLKDKPAYAIRQMKQNGVSSAYVVTEKMRFVGVVDIDDAIRGEKERLPLSEIVNKKVETCSPDTLLHEILPVASTTPFPLAVLDKEGSLKGIIAKAQILSSLI